MVVVMTGDRILVSLLGRRVIQVLVLVASGWRVPVAAAADSKAWRGLLGGVGQLLLGSNLLLGQVGSVFFSDVGEIGAVALLERFSGSFRLGTLLGRRRVHHILA